MKEHTGIREVMSRCCRSCQTKTVPCEVGEINFAHADEWWGGEGRLDGIEEE